MAGASALRDSLPEGGDGSLQGASRRGPRTVALPGQQAVCLKGKHPVRVIRDFQVLPPVAARSSEALYRLASYLDGDAGLENTPEHLSYWSLRCDWSTMQMELHTDSSDDLVVVFAGKTQTLNNHY